MKNKLSSIIGNRLPEYIRFSDGNNKSFQLFIEAYYEFLEQRKGATGLVDFHSKNIDIDDTLDEFIQNFFDEYGEYIPVSAAHNRREILKKLPELYRTKGTEASVKLLFKMIYGVDISVSYPGQFILKASDGRWEQRLSLRILVSTGVSSLDNKLFILQKEFQWDNKKGLQSSIIQDIRKIKDNVYDVFIFNTALYTADKDDAFRILNSDGSTVATGFIRQIPVAVSAAGNPGKNFKVGQILKLPAPNRKTIVKVISVGPDGEISKLEILDAGGDYTSNASSIVSPFPFSLDSFTRISTSLDEFGDTIINVETNERTNGFIESISISKDLSTFDPAGYFAEQYVQGIPAYNTAIIRELTIDNTLPEVTGGNNAYNITPDEYSASLSILKVELGTITKYTGRFVTEDGQISNSNIKIQDSLFHQNYSYVINSPIPIKKYKELFLKLVHPVGYKLFSNLSIDVEADFSSIFGVDLDRDIFLNLDSAVSPIDAVFKAIASNKSDSITGITDSNRKAIASRKTETITPTDVNNKSIQSLKEDSQLIEDDDSKSIASSKADSVTEISDNNTKAIAVTESDSVAAITDDNTKAITETKTDSVITSDSNTKAITTTESDSVTAADNATFASSVENVNTSFSDMITAADSMTSATSYVRTLSDSINTTDSGEIIVSSPYAEDPTYFAEDYSSNTTTTTF